MAQASVALAAEPVPVQPLALPPAGRWPIENLMCGEQVRPEWIGRLIQALRVCRLRFSDHDVSSALAFAFVSGRVSPSLIDEAN